ncbi:hypothetical protein D3C73_1153490 [compost metagenome]
MIGVGVGFQQPLHLQAVLAHERDDPVRLQGGGSPGSRVVVEHRVDDRTLPAIRFVDHVTVGGRGIVEKGFNQGRHEGCFFVDKS